MEKQFINISTGELKTGGVGDILVSNAIGSCIVVTAIDVVKRIGVLAHIMLPGKAPAKEKKQKTKYAVDAIDNMLQIFKKQGVATSNLYLCLIGAGNVLKKEDDTICNSNIQSVTQILREKQLKISAKALGGTLRRSVRFDIENASVYYTKGELKEMLLWHYYK